MDVREKQTQDRPPAVRHAARQTRVVVVRAEDLADRLTKLGAERDLAVARCASFLSAMGELAVRKADAVIGPVSAMAGIETSTAQSLRRLAPNTRLVLIAGHDERDAARQALDAGCDIALPPEADDEALLDAIKAPPLEPVVHEAADDATQTSDAVEIDAADLGDTDLVEALLHGGGGMPERAIEMALAQSGVEGLGWTPEGETLPDGRIGAVVELAGHRFGMLHGPAEADRGEVEGWAAWLARWLALDRQMHELRDMAFRDPLTGVWNRRYFERFLKRVLDRAKQDRSQVTLLVFDIDNFKTYNDRFGHLAGDEILCETARLMQSVVREHDVVARVGGDEFAVIFWDHDAKRRPDSKHPQDVLAAARRFQNAICTHRFPKLLDEAQGTLTISGGLSSYPWDGRTPTELYAHADQMALRSKTQGKNAITLGQGALRTSESSA